MTPYILTKLSMNAYSQKDWLPIKVPSDFSKTRQSLNKVDNNNK